MATTDSDNRQQIARLPTRPVSALNNTSARHLLFSQISLEDRYDPPANFLEIEVVNPETHGFGGKRYTDYEIRMKVKNAPATHSTTSASLDKPARLPSEGMYRASSILGFRMATQGARTR